MPTIPYPPSTRSSPQSCVPSGAPVISTSTAQRSSGSTTLPQLETSSVDPAAQPPPGSDALQHPSAQLSRRHGVSRGQAEATSPVGSQTDASSAASRTLVSAAAWIWSSRRTHGGEPHGEAASRMTPPQQLDEPPGRLWQPSPAHEPHDAAQHTAPPTAWTPPADAHDSKESW